MTGAAVQGKRKTKVGRVVSDKMDKTIVVSVERMTRHPLVQAGHPLDDASSRPTTRTTRLAWATRS